MERDGSNATCRLTFLSCTTHSIQYHWFRRMTMCSFQAGARECVGQRCVGGLRCIYLSSLQICILAEFTSCSELTCPYANRFKHRPSGSEQIQFTLHLPHYPFTQATHAHDLDSFACVILLRTSSQFSKQVAKVLFKNTPKAGQDLTRMWNFLNEVKAKAPECADIPPVSAGLS